MEKNEVDENKIFVEWFKTDLTLKEVDDWVNDKRKLFDPEEEITFEAVICGKKGRSLISDFTSGELGNIKPPDPSKPARLRLANKINYKNEIYSTLRKLNFAINLDLKEDIVSETIIYFMNRWDKYEYHPHTIPIAVQKFKSLNIDVYRKDKKSLSIDEINEEGSYLPQSLQSIEGQPLEELEKKQEFTKIKNAISQMDEKCRELLSYVSEGRSESEIQKILDIPLGTVSSRKSNCIKKLAEIIKND